jgi:NDP-sugar pyrophosphorylase family protein
MGPLTADRPKPLVKVAGRPLVDHVLDALPPVEGVVIVVGYRADRLREHVGSEHEGTPVEYVTQPEPVGLADAVLRAEPLVPGPFVLVNGDNVVRAPLDPLVARHRETDADATLLTERVSEERAREVGVVVTDDRGRVERVAEKPADPPSTLVQTGCFALSQSVFDACRSLSPSDRGEYELADAMTRLAREGRVEAVDIGTTGGWRLNVNTPADIERAEARLAEEEREGR